MSDDADAPQQSRADFERYFAASRKSKGAGRDVSFSTLPDGTYADDHTQRHWWTWQQAQASERERCAALVQSMDTGGYGGYIETASDLCDALAEHIRSRGP